MSKRKAGVNDIIYELDNDDIEISSEDEAKDAKITRTEAESSVNDSENTILVEERSQEECAIVATSEETEKSASPTLEQNGGKTSPASTTVDEEINLDNGIPPQNVENDVDIEKKITADGSKTTILNEDIEIDSPASNSDLGVVGCENRTPLVTIKFKDNKLAKGYKEKIKTFMLRLIKLHEVDSSDTETDLELDIWPEDLIENDFEMLEEKEMEKEPEDELFFIDTAPCDAPAEVPTYSQASTLISNKPDREPTPPPTPMRRGPICFNCDGNHRLQDCQVPKNRAKIAENRKNMTTRVGRYHVEDEQKYGHLIPGRISGQLRHALGLKRNELPLHIYRMRLLGYPPGWLEEARISHSGITMFDSSGTAIQDPEEEEGEVCEPGSKDKFDIKKILDFPGFNVKASSRYKEESHLYGLPPMSEQDSKIAMLQMLAPNAMKAYKRKKLTFFPSAAQNTNQEGQAEMELDSGDETVDFPSNPPLPDEAPPEVPRPPPPPPQSPPPLPESPPPLPKSPPPLPKSPPPVPEPDDIIALDTDDDKTDLDNSADDLVLVENDVSVVTVDDSIDEKQEMSEGRCSPTLDDLEEKKKKLLDALQGEISLVESDIGVDNTENTETNNTDKTIAQDDTEGTQNTQDSGLDTVSNDTEEMQVTQDTVVSDQETVKDNTISEAPAIEKSKVISPKTPNNPKTSTSDSDSDSKSELRAGHVKTTLYGTPVMNVASPYVKLPSDDKFAKDICDVINFENLPNSTGKFKKISSLLKKVKNEVDRIQES